MRKRTGGRRQWDVEQRKAFALRLYRAMEHRSAESGGGNAGSPFEWFKKKLAAKRSQIREVTVRGWLPPLTALRAEPVRGSKVKEDDWQYLITPDVATLCEVADLLDVSVDYLRGRPVPMRLSDREPPGELAGALRTEMLECVSGLTDWDDADIAVAEATLPSGQRLLALTAELLVESLMPQVTAARSTRLQKLLLEAESGYRQSRVAKGKIAQAMLLPKITPHMLQELQRLGSPPSVPPARKLRTRPRRTPGRAAS